MLGLALVVLRSAVAITVFVDTVRRPILGSAALIDVLVALMGLCLFFQLGMSALTAAAAVVLGPGAYSLDARLSAGKKSKYRPDGICSRRVAPEALLSPQRVA